MSKQYIFKVQCQKFIEVIVPDNATDASALAEVKKKDMTEFLNYIPVGVGKPVIEKSETKVNPEGKINDPEN